METVPGATAEGLQGEGTPADSRTGPPLGAPLDDLLPRHFAASRNTLVIGGIPVDELVARHGTPLFAYDRAILETQLGALRGELPDRFDLAFSVKANPNAAILRFFVDAGLGLEIASAGELLQALAAGCNPERILFAGPGKTTEDLEYAVRHGVGEIHVESLAEARRLARVAHSAGARVRIALRVNPAAAVEGGGMRMGARAVPFGMDEDGLDAVLDHVLAEPSLELVGVHLFVGTQILDHDVLLRQYREGIRIARHVAEYAGRSLETVDLGGGLGVPYLPTEPRLDLAALGEGLHALMREVEADARLADARFVLEPGRFLVAEAGVYLVTVTEVKQSRGKTFIIADGGMHHHLAASGNLGQTIKRNFPIAVARRLEADAIQVADLVGPLCTPLDTVGRGLTLPAVEDGDVIAIFQSGAYALTASPTGFLSRPRPAEVLVDGIRSSVVGRPGRPEDYVAGLTGAGPGE